MTLNDWIELSTVIGELQGMATALEHFSDVSPTKVAQALRSLSKRVEKIKENASSEVEELEAQRARRDQLLKGDPIKE